MPGCLSPHLVAVIPIYRNFADTEECLRSLAMSSRRPDVTLVVDDGSGDDTADRLSARFDWITILRRPVNSGYARTVNDGFAWALENGARFVLLLNNDIVVAPEMVSELFRVLEPDPTIGICGPKIFYHADPTRIWALGGRVNLWTGRTRHHALNQTHVGTTIPSDVYYVPGTCQLIRREVIEKVGPLDESYKAYYEEVDFCAAARARGFRTVAIPAAVMWHKISASMGGPKSAKVRYLMTRNRHFFMRKHVSGWRFARYLFADSLISSAECILNLLRFRPRSAFAVLRGWCHGLAPR